MRSGLGAALALAAMSGLAMAGSEPRYFGREGSDERFPRRARDGDWQWPSFRFYDNAIRADLPTPWPNYGPDWDWIWVQERRAAQRNWRTEKSGGKAAERRRRQMARAEGGDG